LAQARRSIDSAEVAIRKADADRDTARAQTAKATALASKLEEDRKKETGRRETLEQKLTQADITIRQLTDEKESLQRSVDSATTLQAQMDAKLERTNRVLRRVRQQRLLLRSQVRNALNALQVAEADATLLRHDYPQLLSAIYDLTVDARSAAPPHPEPGPRIGLEDGIYTARYAATLVPNLNLLVDRSGRYLNITLKPTEEHKEFDFSGLTPPLITNEEEFFESATLFIQDFLHQRQQLKGVELLVRGNADTRPIRNQPDPLALSALSTYHVLRRIAANRYSSARDPDPKQISFPLKNDDLPNLRGVYVAVRFSTILEKRGMRVPVRILDQVPKAPATPGKPQTNIKPELFLYKPDS
jgi:hypothetical protein